MFRSLTLALAASVALSGAAAAQSKELFLYNWSNYFPPDLLKKFEADTGIQVTLDVYDSNETMLAKLQAGATGYDVVVPSDYMVRIMFTTVCSSRSTPARWPTSRTSWRRTTTCPSTPSGSTRCPISGARQA